MPQLVKGGKHAYGWSRVGEKGCIILPPEAIREYRLGEPRPLLVIPGSRTSGGFSIGSQTSLGRSPLGALLDRHPEVRDCLVPEGELVDCEGRAVCWVQMRNGQIKLPLETLQSYGIDPGDELLVIRGSGLALAFSVRGPVLEEARKHPELLLFAPS